MATPWTIRFAPTVRAILGMAVIRAAGMPDLSISLVSVAPQRVPVPQVDVMTTPSTPSLWSMAAISRP